MEDEVPDPNRENARELEGDLQTLLGNQLRSVVYYSGQNHEIVYVRSDVDAAYNEANVESVVEDLIAESLEREHKEALFVHGDLECIVRYFRNATEIHIPHGQIAGTAIAVESGCSGMHSEVVGRIRNQFQ